MSWADGVALAIRIIALLVAIAYFVSGASLGPTGVRLMSTLVLVGLACIAFGGLVSTGLVAAPLARFVYSAYSGACLVVVGSLLVEAQRASRQ